MCERANRMPLIGEKAPEFEAETTQGPIHFPNDYEGKRVVFFSHPADFTPVCTTDPGTGWRSSPIGSRCLAA